MKADHLEILVEEPSMEAFLRELLPRLLGNRATFRVYPSQGKDDLLRNLPARLKAYAKFLPANYRIVVVVDRDGDDCLQLKKKLDGIAAEAGLATRKGARVPAWRVVNRIAVEELEAWYFGDWEAVLQCYPGVPRTLEQRAGYRDPDDIRGGTWEAFERLLQKAGYFPSGLGKTEVARSLGKLVMRERTRSRSFTLFCDVLLEACA
jgi:hypothetical protein